MLKTLYFVNEKHLMEATVTLHQSNTVARYLVDFKMILDLGAMFSNCLTRLDHKAKAFAVHLFLRDCAIETNQLENLMQTYVSLGKHLTEI